MNISIVIPRMPFWSIYPRLLSCICLVFCLSAYVKAQDTHKKYRIGLMSSSHIFGGAFMLQPEIQISATEKFEIRVSGSFHQANNQKYSEQERFNSHGYFAKFGVAPILKVGSKAKWLLRPGLEYSIIRVNSSNTYSFQGVKFEDADFTKSRITTGHGLTIHLSFLTMLTEHWFIDLSPRVNVPMVNQPEELPMNRFIPGMGYYSPLIFDLGFQIGCQL